MRISDLFTSRHTKWLEKEHADLKARVAEIEKFYTEQLKDAITQNHRLQDELQRTRILLSPGLQSVSLPHEETNDTPPPASEEPTGTPWMRIRARMIREQEERARKAPQPTAEQKGDSNGVSSEGRVSPPLSEQSKPS